jgi:hypothetical protein
MNKIKKTNPIKTGLQLLLLLAIVALNLGPGGTSPAYAAAPLNDTFAGAITVPSVPWTDTQNTTEAHPLPGPYPGSPPTPGEAGEPGEKGPGQLATPVACDGKLLRLGTRTIWYKYTPTTSGVISMDTVGTNYDDTYMVIWKAGTVAGLANLVLVACDDDNEIGFTSQISANLTAGTTYYIQVAKYNGVTTNSATIDNEPCATGTPQVGTCTSVFNVKNQTFADVPPTHPYFQYIEVLYANGYTNGCNTSPLRYCPSSIMNRAQVAKFFMTVQFGGTYLPPANVPLLFKDNWSVNPWAQSWANDMLDKGLTSGCRALPLLYCPDNQVIREQVAKFGLAIKHGNAYLPPPATGTVFADLTDVNYWATPWAEQAYLEGLVPSCGTDVPSGKPKFCKDGLVDRGFAAFVIVTAKGLLGP